VVLVSPEPRGRWRRPGGAVRRFRLGGEVVPELPLSATVELHDPSRVPTCHEACWTLHYVLAGRGSAVACPSPGQGADGSGESASECGNDVSVLPLSAGDSVLFPPGAAHVLRPEGRLGSLATLALVLPQGLEDADGLASAAGVAEAAEYAGVWAREEGLGELSAADVAALLGLEDGEDDEAVVIDAGAGDTDTEDSDSGLVARNGLLKKGLRELVSFKPPNGDSNSLALVFSGGEQGGLPFTFALEIFRAGHRTPPHVHETAHELFFVLKGSGEVYCGGTSAEHRVPIGPGDLLVMPPGATHGIDAGGEEPLYTLELMLPNANFAEFVRAGAPAGRIEDEALCDIIHVGCAAGE